MKHDSKKLSPAQKRQRAKMKCVMRIAKKHQKEHPQKSWQNCVKYAWTQV